MTLSSLSNNRTIISSSNVSSTILSNITPVLGYSGSVIDNYGGSATANNLLVQVNGKIVVVGSAYNANTGSFDFAISRYNSNGSLDTSFSSDGRQTTDFAYDSAYRVSALANGKLLVSGVSVNLVTQSRYYVQSQYMSNGSLDTSFDGDGKSSRVLKSTDGFGLGSATQVDGKLVQLDASNGFGVVRYNLNGTIDAGFGNKGIVNTSFLTATGSAVVARHLVIQGDGKIVVVGNTNHAGIALVRYNSNGSLDASFSGDGLLIKNFGDSVYANSVTVQADAKIVVAGYSQDNTGNNSLFLARFNADGNIDAQFNKVASVKPGVTFTNITNMVTTEVGGTTSFGLVLKAAPYYDVRIILTSSDATEGVFKINLSTTQTLIFTPANWNQVQTVSLKGVDDKLVDGDVAYIISTKVISDDINYDGMISGSGLSIANVLVNNTDDDAPDTQVGDKDPRRKDDVLFGGNGASDINGKEGNDELHGGKGDDRLFGGNGNDALYGEAGNDILTGGAGTDKLTGGLGSDIFDFNAISESVIGKTHDVIIDFAHTQADKIDLKGIDANLKFSGDQAFKFLGSNAFDGNAGEIQYLNSILSGDINGDKVADFEVAVTLVGTLV